MDKKFITYFFLSSQKLFILFYFLFLAVQEERGPRKSSKVVNKIDVVEVPKPWQQKSSVDSISINNLASQQQWKEGI